MVGAREHRHSSQTAFRAPLFPEVGVLGLVPDVWGSPWMVRHHVFTRLAEYFHVAWVDPPRGWRECWLGQSSPTPSCSHEGSVRPGFSVYTPGRWAAKFYRPALLARLSERSMFVRAARILKKRGCRRTIVYLWRPEFDRALDCIRPEISCYHLDDEYTFSRHELPTDLREARLLDRVDHVFVHSPALLEKKSPWNPNTHLLRMGADYAAFSTPRPEPDDLHPIPHPRVGYVGYIKGQLNFPLLAGLARAHPYWSFVFVGPASANLSRHAAEYQALSCLPNVHMLGECPVGSVPAYVQHMDVLTLAYRINDYTKFISPMKLQEYLATGRPVVGSPIHYLRLFSGVIALAETPRQWSAALAEALSPQAVTAHRVQQRRQVARSYDWDRVVRRIAGLLCESLGDDYVRRITEAHGSQPARSGGNLPAPAAVETGDFAAPLPDGPRRAQASAGQGKGK